MKEDLAPKSSLVKSLLISLTGLVIAIPLHLFAMNVFIQSDNFFPFIITSMIGTGCLWLPALVLNKFRYVIHNDKQRQGLLIIGNFLSDEELTSRDLIIEKQVWRSLYRVIFKGKSLYIVSSNEKVEWFKNSL